MTRATPLTAYLAWAIIIAIGGLLAFLDMRWKRRPLLGVLLIVGIVGGFVVTEVSPFDFVTGGYYMEGVIAFGASALALIGYVCVTLWRLTWCTLKRRSSK